MLRKKQKSGGRWLIIEQKIMLQFRYIFSRLSIKIRKEAFSYFPRVWRMKKWTKVMMKWSLLKETFNNIGKTFISSFSFFFFSYFILNPGFHRRNTCFVLQEYTFFCTNQKIWGWGCVVPNFQLNFQRIFFPHPGNYSLKCTTNEILGIDKMRFRLQNSKYIWGLVFSLWSYHKIVHIQYI